MLLRHFYHLKLSKVPKPVTKSELYHKLNDPKILDDVTYELVLEGLKTDQYKKEMETNHSQAKPFLLVNPLPTPSLNIELF